MSVLPALSPDETRAVRAVLADPVCRTVLERMPRLGLAEWWLTAGAVFQNVWTAQEGRPAGFGIKDYDVFYFDAADLGWDAEDEVIRAVADLFSDVNAFASTTCCVGMTTAPDGSIRVHAPHGLQDVFDRVMRPNPRLAPREVYETKVAQYRERWPSVTAEPWPVDV